MAKARVLVPMLAGAVLAASMVVGVSPARAAACSGVAGDINGDGYADLVVVGGNSGRADASPSAQGLHVFYGTAQGVVTDPRGGARDDQVVLDSDYQDDPIVDTIGAAVAVADVNGDGCADVASGGHGAFSVFSGSPQGLITDRSVRTLFTYPSDLPPSPERIVPTGAWGSVLAAGDFDGDGIADLALGDPDDTTNGLGPQVGGQVFISYGSKKGLMYVRAGQAFTQNTPGVPGASEKGDEMGAAVATGDLDGDGVDDLAVGVPGENTKTGAVLTFHGVRGQGLQISGTATSQSSSSVPGAKQVAFRKDGHVFGGTRFGDVLAMGDINGDGQGDLAVRSTQLVKLSTGAITHPTTILYSKPHAKTAPWAGKSTNRLIAGRALGEPYPTGFPALLARLDSDRYADLVIGDPNAIVNGREAGSITVYRGHKAGIATTGRQISQATSGVAGTPEDRDAFGSALTAVPIQDPPQHNLVVAADGEWLRPGPRPELYGDAPVGMVTQFAIGAQGPRASGSTSLTLDTPGVQGDAGVFGTLLG